MLGGEGDVCTFGELPKPVKLKDAVERALCNHPKTRQAWVNVKIQAAAVGAARAAFLPTVTATWQGTRNNTVDHVTGYRQYDSNHRSTRHNASVSLSWVLYDFGGRSAALRDATELLVAARANQQAVLQTAFSKVAKDFYAAQAAQASLAAAREIELAARSSASAAAARADKGIAAISDQLQAQTALADAIVNRTKAESDMKSAIGALATDMNLTPATEIVLPDVGEGVTANREFSDSVTELIYLARRRYPGVLAAEAQVEAAKAKAARTRAEGLPRLSIVGQYNYNNQPTSLQLGFAPLAATHREWYLGLQMTIPIFEGFARTYQAKQADAQVELQTYTLDETRQQTGLDVWNAYQALQSSMQNLENSAELLSLAERSHDAAEHRYRMGAGSILELLNVQSALAGAKRQRIQALTDWRSARLQLAAKLGQIGMWSLASGEDSQSFD
ncbi:TolC family protein [Burkholderia sp. AU19243]|nr:TolC family protein [Burkholderia sp. AU19243]MBR8140857.1 TolC family protein [Burkholderia vietnamiensis]MBR8361814.1 TolC family protein [Burkholderia sp. AU19243]